MQDAGLGHAAALYIVVLNKGGDKGSWQNDYHLEDMRQSLIQTADEIMKLQHQTLGDKVRPNSLNFCVMDGVKMVAIRFRNHKSHQPPSLYWSEFAGRTLNTRFEGHPDGPKKKNRQASFGPEMKVGRHTISVSELTAYDEKEWHLIKNNCALTVDDGIEPEMPIVYDETLNAMDPARSKLNWCMRLIPTGDRIMSSNISNIMNNKGCRGRIP